MSVITSQFYCLPPERRTNADLPKDLCEFIGVEERRINGDNLKMAYYASKRLDLTGVDTVLYVSESHAYQIPCNASILACALKINPSICMDIQMGCSGFPYGLKVADHFIQCGSSSKVLLVNSDTITSYVSPFDTTLKSLHGDAAAATLVEATGIGGLISKIELGTDPSLWELITRKEGWVSMSGAEVGHAVLNLVPKILAKYDLEKYNTILFHQANDTITQMLYAKLGIRKEQQFRFIKTVGNLSNASTPVLMCEAMKANKITDVTRVLVVSFGAGFSWGVVDLRYDGLQFPIGSVEQTYLEKMYGEYPL